MPVKFFQLNAFLFLFVSLIGMKSFAEYSCIRSIEAFNNLNDSIISTNIHSTSNSIPIDSLTTTTHQAVFTNNNIPTIPINVENKADTIIDFNITSAIQYLKSNQFKTIQGKQLFLNGIESEEKYQQLVVETDQLRHQYNQTIAQSTKEKIATKVLELELEMINLKTTANQSFLNAREQELTFWNSASEDEIQQLMEENKAIKAAQAIINIPVVEEITEEVAADSLTVNEQQPIDKAEDVPINNEGVVYKVQIGSYSTALPESAKRLHKKLSVLRKIDNYIDDRGVTVYTIGELNSTADAVKLQNQIRQEGVKDAFVIAIYNGKRITLKEAKDINGK